MSNVARHGASRIMLSLVALAALAASGIAAADDEQPLSIELKSTAWTGDLDVLAARRAIRVLVPYSKTLYFVDLGGVQRGISYDFMRAFEDALNKKLGRTELRVHVVFIPVSRDHLVPMLMAGEGDVVAANLTVTPERSRLVDFVTPAATGVREVIVTGSGAPPLHSLDDLAGQQVYVRRSTSYYQSLAALNESFRTRKLAPIKLREAPERFETEDLLEMVNAGLVPIVVADD
jgi:ABC-type amino acid transport substrate-binding protein